MKTTPECPRCGYDLSGEIESWREACPLDGVCSECGLAMRWAELLNDRFRRPPWLFERAERALWLAFLRTALRVLLPARFWGSIRMEHPIAWRRLVVFVVLALPALYALLLSAPMAAALMLGNLANGYVPTKDLASHWHLIAVPVGNLYRWSTVDVRADVGLAILAALLTPMTLFLLPVTLCTARIRRVHVCRVGLYTISVTPLFVAVVVLWPMLYTAVQAAGHVAWAPRWIYGLAGWIVTPLEHASDWLVVAWAALLLWWWLHAVLRRYLRLDVSWWVAAVLTLLAWVTAVAATFLAPGGIIRLMYDLGLATIALAVVAVCEAAP
ncbi:MAG: hypothetical protein AAGK04_08395 [Planctomycetota bacterium]